MACHNDRHFDLYAFGTQLAVENTLRLRHVEMYAVVRTARPRCQQTQCGV